MSTVRFTENSVKSVAFGGAGILVAVVLLLGAWAAPVLAGEVPANLRAAILLRALAYERGMVTSPKNPVLAIVGGHSGPSADDARGTLAAFREITPRMLVGRRPLRVVNITFVSVSQVVQAVHAASANAVYVATGLEEIMPALSAALPTSSRFVLCGRSEAVGRGCVLSVEPSGRSSQLVIDLPGSIHAGLSFNVRLLRLARIVR